MKKLGFIASIGAFTLVGVSGYLFINSNFLKKIDTGYIKTFKEEGKPSVLRRFRSGMDFIYVQNPTNSDNYQNFREYLDLITNKQDRAAEKARIEKLVDW